MQAVYLDYDSAACADLDTSGLLALLPSLQFFEQTPPSEVAARIRDVDIVLADQAPVGRDALLGARNLRLIAIAGTGYDKIDVATARERGIALCHVRGYCTTSVAQHAWSMILSLTQRLDAFRRYATDGSWAQLGAVNVQAISIRELAGRMLGIVGWGELGGAVAKIGESFGMRVVVANRPGTAPIPGRLPLPDLLATADIVSLHCPLSDATRGMIGARELALMKPDALLINTARGGLVDSQALAEALRAGRLAGAGIDVLAQEPPLDGDALLDPTIPNLIVTPHVAWAAHEARQRSLDELTANVRDFLAGGRRGRVV
jgi:glycerate dehydrogenase